MADNSHLRGAEFNFPGEGGAEGRGKGESSAVRLKAFLRRGVFPAGFVHRRLHKPARRRVHASVIYVISEVFFGSIRLERRARTRVRARHRG